MGVMDSRMEASKLGLSWGMLTVSERKSGREERVQGAQSGVPIAEMGVGWGTGRICFVGRFVWGVDLYLFWAFPGALLNAELWSQPVITFMCLFFMFPLF